MVGRMFTGIIEEVGEIVEAAGGVLRIRAPKVLADSKLGDSIAINGVDLTVAEMDRETFMANVMPETYRRSNLSGLYMVVKGPVAIDGASLTIIDKSADTFAVSLVQYTQEHTNLLGKKAGDTVNIETDIVARYVEQMLGERVNG
jgi:riboflavin synthase